MVLFNIFLTLFFVFLNGFFVAAEFAIVKVRASQLELRVRDGSSLAKIAKGMVNHLDAYLSATQLGITLASLGLGWIGESVVASLIINLLHFINIEVSPELIHQISLPVAFAVITFLHIVLGELAPKSLAIQRSETVTLVIALPLKIFYTVFKPFIWFLNYIANSLVKMLGFEPVTEEQDLHSSDELRYLIEESTKSGLLDKTEHEMLENVFDFSGTPVKQIMVPHNQIIGVDLSMSTEDIMNAFIDEGVSRMPVFNQTVDNIVGVIYAKDVLSMLAHKDLILISDIIRPPFLVNEDEKIKKLLRDLQYEKIHLAVVIDEFGGTAGIVTLEDILEEIVGEIQDEYDEESPFVKVISDKEFLVDASAAIDDANDTLPIDLPESDDYETVGGLILHATGRIPEENEKIELDNYLCIIISRETRTLLEVKLILKD